MAVLKLLSLNVRGLRNREKRRSIFLYLKNQKASVYLLQETFSNHKDEKIWSAEWGGQIFLFSHVSDHSKGVCVLIKPNCVLSAEALELDSNGRFIILRLKTGENALYVINVYAPTDKREQIDFIDFLSKKVISLTDTSNLVIAGDWNTTLSAMDKTGRLAL